MNILLLGGNGYLGSKIINHFSHLENVSITCTIRKGESLNLLELSNNVNIIDSTPDVVKKTIIEKKFDVMINTVCTYENNASFIPVISGNLIYPLEILSFGIENGINVILTIDTSLPGNLNMYSLTKECVSKICSFYCKKFSNLVIYNIKLENFYGEDEPKNRFLHSVVQKMKKGENVELTNGNQRRDFIYIDDVVEGIRLLLFRNQKAGFYSIPLGTGEGPTIKEVILYLHSLLKSKSKLLFGAIPYRENEPNCVANMEYMKSIGFTIKYPYKKGLIKIIEEI